MDILMEKKRRVDLTSSQFETKLELTNIDEINDSGKGVS